MAISAILGGVSAAEPYTPTDDAEVLESLPRSLLTGRDELANLRRQLSTNPRDADVAAEAAGRYLEMGNREGDPRFFGYARAAIAPWWESADPPAEILGFRAKLKEKDHRYDDASADLELLLRIQPQNAQAWVELGNIYRIQGKYADAQQVCETLSELDVTLPILACRIPLQAVTGEAKLAYQVLGRAVPIAKERKLDALTWMLTMQAGIAQALGMDEQAEQHFREGLAESPADGYLLREFADFLLDHDRHEEVVALLRDHTRDNGILLRAAIAARRSADDQQAKAWQSQLAQRFEEIRLRGSVPHLRYEARFALELQQDPHRALELALENWQSQKQKRDSRNVLEAALAADKPVAAQPVLDFLDKHNTEDVVLERLAQELRKR